MFRYDEALPVLLGTPATLRALLARLPSEWIESREKDESWSPFDVLGHLIHGERTDWIPRARRILEGEGERPFPPFDRFAQLESTRGRTLASLLDEFDELRTANVIELEGWDLQPSDLVRPGLHPEFGPVTLDQLLCTWVVHDLGHLAQISRAMCARYRDAVGPWRAYLPVLGP